MPMPMRFPPCRRGRGLTAAAALLAAAAAALAAGTATAQATISLEPPPPFSSPHNSPFESAAAPPLPVGTDPAMRPRGGGSSTSTSTSSNPPALSPDPTLPLDAPPSQNHPMDHLPQQEPQGQGEGGDGGGLAPVDLMRDGCFAPSGNLGDYNEYGFRKVPAGSQLGAWFVASGDVDEYYAPAVDASPAAKGGADTTPPSPDAADPDNTGDDGPSGADSELSWLLPPGVGDGCQAVLDINGEKPASLMQTFQTVPNGAYRLEFSFAGDALPHNLGPPPHRVPSFKSVAVFWDGRKVGDIYINALEKENVGMDWAKATYVLNATSTAATLVIMSTTKGRSGLAVTDFHLLNVTGLPNGGSPVPTPIHPRPPHDAIDTGSGNEEEGPSMTAPGGNKKRGRGGSGVGVLFALLAIVLIVGAGLFVVLGGHAAGFAGFEGTNGSWLGVSSFLPSFLWGGREEGYGVLGGVHGGSGGGGYQSPYQQQGAVEMPVATRGGSGWAAASAVMEEGEGGDSDGDEEVFYSRGPGRGGGESKRDGVVGMNGGGGGGKKKGRQPKQHGGGGVV